MAIIGAFTQIGDKLGGSVFTLAAHSPLFFVAEITITVTPKPDLLVYVTFVVGATTYTFNMINIDYDGSIGTD